MKNKKDFYLIVYLISFILVWVIYIFWFENNEFDLEFREKEIATATIFNTGTNEIVEELYDGRKTNVYENNYIEYSYYINGKTYKSGDSHYEENYSISDKIEIEYVKNNPSISRIKGQHKYSFNFFIRNLILVCVFSFLVMYCIIEIFDFFQKLILDKGKPK
jgi:hypothetical protein